MVNQTLISIVSMSFYVVPAYVVWCAEKNVESVKKAFDSVDHGYNFAESSARAPYVTDFCIVNHLYTLFQH